MQTLGLRDGLHRTDGPVGGDLFRVSYPGSTAMLTSGFPAWWTPEAAKLCAVGHGVPGRLSRSFVRGALHLDSRASMPHLHHGTLGDPVSQQPGEEGSSPGAPSSLRPLLELLRPVRV